MIEWPKYEYTTRRCWLGDEVWETAHQFITYVRLEADRKVLFKVMGQSVTNKRNAWKVFQRIVQNTRYNSKRPSQEIIDKINRTPLSDHIIIEK